MTYSADPRVDAYIDALPVWQQAICRQVRELVHAADPDVSETIKRTNRPYFLLEGNICAVLAAKNHVNIFLYDGAIVPDPEGIITAGHANKTARTVAVRQGETINAPALFYGRDDRRMRRNVFSCHPAAMLNPGMSQENTRTYSLSLGSSVYDSPVGERGSCDGPCAGSAR